MDWIQILPLSPAEVTRRGRARAGVSKIRSPREIGVTDTAPIALQLRRIPRHGNGSVALPRLLVVDTETMKDVVVSEVLAKLPSKGSLSLVILKALLLFLVSLKLII